MKKIVVLDGYTLNPGDLSWNDLDSFGEVTIYDRTPPDQIISRAAGCEIVITNKTPLSRDTIRSLPAMKYIGVLATGYNVVDIPAASENGIVVTNIPAYGTQSVAQMVFAHLLGICQQVSAHNAAVKGGEWGRKGDFCFWNYPLMELAGKTMGIIGMGKIGQAVARIALAMGMKIIAFDPDPKTELADENFRFGCLDELFRKSDVISLHCPLNETNRGMINRESISRMRDGVILINTSRGQLIVEEDLAEALKSGKILAAGLDVLQMEPPPDDHPLLHLPNCIITPHIAWAPREARIRLFNIAIENLRSFIAGSPVNVVSQTPLL
jgi:glycerate dehydrogenase